MSHYHNTRPVIVRSKYKDRESHYVMTAKEAGESVARALMTSGPLINITIIPVDGVSDAYLDSQR